MLNQNQLRLPDYLHQQLLVAKKPRRILLKDGRSYNPDLISKEDLAKMSVMFLRNDEWSLGAVPETEAEAYHMWQDSWVGFVRNGKYQPISEYATI